QRICEAVFRWQFTHISPAHKQRTRVYFLQMGGSSSTSDPPEGFVDRFQDRRRPIRPVSACDPNMGYPVIDKKTKDRGLIFRVTHLLRKSDTEIDVQGGYYEAATSASATTYRLMREQGSWKVVNEMAIWTSKD